MSLVAQIGLLATRVATEFNSLRAERRVVVATTANITLSGTQTIDGYAAAVGDLVLVKNQTTPSQNGVYKVASGAWTRVTRFSTSAGISGTSFEVMKGTINGGTSWQTTFKATDTIGTTAMVWTYIGDLPGTIKMWGGSTLPDGWMWCNGASLAITDYPAYNYYVGANYGGTGTANDTPYLVDRFPRGSTLGDMGGSDTHSHDDGTLSAAAHAHTDGTLAVASHTHTSAAHVHAVGDHKHGLALITNNPTTGSAGRVGASFTDVMSSAVNTSSTTPGATGASAPAVNGTTDTATADVTGSTGTSSNVPNYTGVNFIIKII